MNTAEALRAIRLDEGRYIQQHVTVDFDSLLQVPIDFCHGSEKHFVRETLGRFRMHPDNFPCGFLVKITGDEVFFLYLHRWGRGNSLNECRWVLSFKILSDRELMTFRPQDLFEVFDAGALPQTVEYAPAYLRCSGGGEGVLLERVISFQGKPYCLPCFHLLNGSDASKDLH